MPVLMPNVGVSRIGVLPDLGVVGARSEGGLIITSRKSDPFWTGKLTTAKLEPWRGNNRHARMLAFLSDCVDRNLRVDWVHPRHDYPGSYTADTWPMLGDGSLNDIVDARTLDVQGLVAGMVLARGDRIAVLQGDIVVHRWVAEDVVVDSAISQAVPVTPRLPVGLLAPSATVRLANPPLRFMIVPGSWDTDEAHEPTSISFDVAEALR